MTQPKLNGEQVDQTTFRWNIVEISGPTSHTVQPDEELLVVDATSGDITINLHSATILRARPLNIKRIDSSINDVFVQAVGSPAEMVDGDSSDKIDGQWTNLTIITNGTQWLIL